MGLFTKEAIRLMREKWADSTELADELFAILTSDAPLTISGPVTITNTTGQPALTINQSGVGDTPISINRRPEAPPAQIPGFPPFPVTGVGSVYVTNYYGDGSSETFSGDGGNPPDPTRGKGQKQGGGGGIPGVIVSGSGDTYQVDLYLAGLGAEPVRKSVKILQIADGAQVPAGTWLLAAQSGVQYVGQVSVWL